MALLLMNAAIAEFINVKWLRLPGPIGLLLFSLVVSLGILIAADILGAAGLVSFSVAVVERANLPQFLFNDALGFLLFATALRTDLAELRSRAGTVLALASVGVLLATTLFGLAIWAVLQALGDPVPAAWCFVLGAILAPTDPIAVTGIMERLNVPVGLRAVIEGESLFNDGISIVVFTVALQAASQGAGEIGAASIVTDFVREGLGGGALGLISGAIAFWAMRRVDEYNLELMISLALVSATYAAAIRLDVSGPIAVVVAGLLIGNHGVAYAMSETTRRNVRLFWSLIDEVLNAVLFLLLGLEMIAFKPPASWPLAVGAAILLAVVTRFVSTGLAAVPLNLNREHHLSALTILTWGGLRGAISVALALSLPKMPYRDTLLAMTYGVVVFTIVVQGLTLPAAIRRIYPE